MNLFETVKTRANELMRECSMSRGETECWMQALCEDMEKFWMPISDPVLIPKPDIGKFEAELAATQPNARLILVPKKKGGRPRKNG
jgi:hypothetical protein